MTSIRVVCKGTPKAAHALVELTQLVDGDLVASDRVSLDDDHWKFAPCPQCGNVFELARPTIADIAAFVESHTSTLQADPVGDDGETQLTLTAFVLGHIVARLNTDAPTA